MGDIHEDIPWSSRKLKGFAKYILKGESFSTCQLAKAMPDFGHQFWVAYYILRFLPTFKLVNGHQYRARMTVSGKYHFSTLVVLIL